ncbi:MAG: SGNH/GDSL hydrolase family protein [Steroidobacteraceae bacterium]
MRTARVLPGLGVVAAMAALAWDPIQAADLPAATPQYVALGSSYAAGPGIAPTVTGSPTRCARSTQNYAHVLASQRGLSLVDVTCSGATTVDVLRGGQFNLPAQLDAVTPATQLVTVTIGGNDVLLMASLFAMSCGSCAVPSDTLVEARFAALPDSLRQVVTGARRRSPNVRVVFVTYFTVLPAQGTCAQVALTTLQADHMRGVATRLAQITRQAARESGADLLDAATLSRAHDACSRDPWVMGAHPPTGVAIPAFHPTQQAMHAVGEALNNYLRDNPHPNPHKS